MAGKKLLIFLVMFLGMINIADPTTLSKMGYDRCSQTCYLDCNVNITGYNITINSTLINFNQFTECSALETDANGLLVCGIDDWNETIGNLTYQTKLINSSNITIVGNQAFYNGTAGGGTDCSVAGSCDKIAYLNYSNTGSFNVSGVRIKLCNEDSTSCLCYNNSGWKIGGTC